MASLDLAREALAIYESALRDFKNVLGTGIVSRGGDDHAVAIYVAVKVPFDELEEEDVLPSFLQVIRLEGVFRVPTRVIEGPAPETPAGRPPRG